MYADAPNDSSSKSVAGVSIPVIRHFAGKGSGPPQKSDLLKDYFYPQVESYRFATPFVTPFHYNTESISHTRNLTLLKEKMNGPYFDLETIWDEHTYYEFADRSVDHTMSTMVQEPYVNHVPTVSSYFEPQRKKHESSCRQEKTDDRPGGISDDGRHWSHKTLSLLPTQLHFQQFC